MIAAPVLRGVGCQHVGRAVGVDKGYLGRCKFYFVVAVVPALRGVVLVYERSVDIVFHGGVVVAARHIEFGGNAFGVEGEDTAEVEVACPVAAGSSCSEVVVVAAVAEGGSMVLPYNLVAVGQHVVGAVGQHVAFFIPLMPQGIGRRRSHDDVVRAVVGVAPDGPRVGRPGLVAATPRRGQRQSAIDEPHSLSLALRELCSHRDARLGEGKYKFIGVVGYGCHGQCVAAGIRHCDCTYHIAAGRNSGNFLQQTR